MVAGAWKQGAQVLFALTIAGAPHARAQDAGTAAISDSEKPIPADLRLQVQRAEHIGPMLYQLDQAAAIASDALGLDGSSPLAASLGGYLAVGETGEEDRPQSAHQVLFYTRDAEPRLAFMVRVPARLGADPTVEKYEPPAVIDESVRRLIRARRTALAALEEDAQRINPVVVPGSLLGEKGDVLVYLLAATTKPKTAVFGKHYRVLVSADGKQIKRFEPLSKSALVVSTDLAANAVGLFVTHLVTQAPLETHIFTSMLQKNPVYVGTSRGLWRITGGHIAFLGAQQPAP